MSGEQHLASLLAIEAAVGSLAPAEPTQDLGNRAGGDAVCVGAKLPELEEAGVDLERRRAELT